MKCAPLRDPVAGKPIVPKIYKYRVGLVVDDPAGDGDDQANDEAGIGKPGRVHQMGCVPNCIAIGEAIQCIEEKTEDDGINGKALGVIVSAQRIDYTALP